MRHVQFFANGKAWCVVDHTDGIDPDRAHVVSDSGEWYPVLRAPFFWLHGLVSTVLVNWLLYYRLDFFANGPRGPGFPEGPEEDDDDDTEIEPEDLCAPEVLPWGEDTRDDPYCPE